MLRLKHFIFLLALLIPSQSFAVKFLKVSTATSVDIGPFVDASIVRQTGLTVTNITCRVIKQSDTSSSSSTSFTGAASGSANDIVHISNGIYNVELSASNTDTVGRLTLDCTCTGTLGTTHDFEVLSANTYDVTPTGNISTNQGVWDVLTSAQSTTGSNGKLLVDSMAELKGRSASITYGTAVGGGSNTIQLAATESGTNSINVGDIVVIKGGTGQYQSAYITAYTGSTQTATTYCPAGTAGAWIQNPDSTSTYVIYPFANVGGYLVGQAPLQPVTAGRTLIVSAGGEADVRAVSGNVGGNVTGSVGSVTGAVGSVTGNLGGNVTGNVTGSVGSLAAQAKIDAQFHRGIITGTAQAGSTTSTIVLASGASATNLSYVYWLVTLTGGTGVGQTAIITNYVGASRTATVLNQNTTTGLWLVTPDNTTTYSLIPFKR